MGAFKEKMMELLQEIKEEVLNEKVLRRVVSVAIVLALIITSIPPFTSTAKANPLGLVIGSSYSISSDGHKLSSAGLIDISEVVFEIGINRDPKMGVNKNGDFTQVINNYQTILPTNMNNTIFFMTPTLYNKIKSIWGKFVIGYYSPGTKTMECAADISALYRVKIMQNISSPPSSYTNGKYYNLLKSNYDPNTIANLANGKWKALLSGDGTAAVQFWSYVLKPQVSGDWASWDIKDKLDAYFTQNTSIKTFDLNKIDDWPPADKWEIKLRYLDLLMMTYEAVPQEATKFKSAWASAIDDYIAGVGLEAKPVTIVITPDVAIHPGDPIAEKTGAVIVRTPDFLNYAAGVESKFFTSSEMFVNIPNDDSVLSYTSETPGDTTRTYNTYTYAVKKSIDMSPNLKRITDAFDPANAFSWGYSAMAKYRLSTSGGVVQWKSTSVQSSYLDVMQIKHPQQISNIKKAVSGFLMIPAPPLSPLSLKIQLSATPDYLIQKGDTLGTVNKLDVTCVPDPKVLAAWKPYIDAAKAQGKNFSVKLKIERTYDQGGYAPNYSPTDLIDPNYRVLTADQFIELLNGNMSISIIDDVSVYPSNPTPGSLKIHRFIYTVTMTATYNSGQPNPPSASAEATDMATIVIEDPEVIMKYISSPDAWAELKQGKPYDEDFEAMAGVPTTETLYLGAGGSEFIVQIQLKYVADEKATRTYKVHYDGGVECEFMNGDTAKFPSGEHSSYEERDFVSGSRSGCGSYDPPPSPNPKSYSWTAASDGKTRSTTEKYQLVSSTGTDHYYETRTDKDGNTYQVHIPSQCTSHWEYYYRYWVDAHEICGPCCEHILPEVNDTWSQEITYDYIKIDDVHVWRIDQASINGMVEIVDKYTQDNDIIFKDGDVIIRAKIKQGTPNIFYNIGEEKAKREGFKYDEKHRSLAGRIRYTIEPQQHDEVVYNMGPRSNKCDGLGKTASGNKIPSGGQGHQHPWATGILYNNTGYPNEVDYHRQKTNSVKTAYSNIADAKDTQTQEWKAFDQFRKMKNTATIISDMLILQTSSGDQSVIYFEKKSNTVRSDENFDPVEATKEEMWDNNPLSAAKWDEKAINIGSYNGKWNSPNKKYDGTGDKKQIKTIFDSAPGEKDPASVSSQYKAAYNYLTRPSRPSQLFLYKDNIKQQIDNINKSYITGEAEVFWEHILSYPSTATALYDTTSKSLYNNEKGYVQKAPYSPEHAKVNDIVVHNPVSTEDAVVVGLDDSRDQRSTMPLGSAEDTINEVNRLTVCPRDPALCEFRVQNCTYFKDVLLAFFDFENGAVNQVTGKSYTLPSGFTIENVNRFGTGKSLSAKGVRWEIPFADLYNPAEGLTKGLQYNPGLPIYVEADFYVPVPATSGTMLASFYRYDLYLPTGSTTPTWNTGRGWERRANVDITNKNIKIGMQFDMNNLDRSKLFINGSEVTNYTRINNSDLITADLVGDRLNIGSWGANDSYPANFYLDNLKIIRKAGTTQHNESCYRTFMVHPDGFNAHVHSAECIDNTSVDIIASLLEGTYVGGSGSRGFGYTGSVQVFTAPATGTYTLEVWGAQGGNLIETGYNPYSGSTYGVGGKGGYSKGEVTLNEGETLYIYVGGKGNGTSGGWNGGGAGRNAGAGGGGATDIRKGGTTLDKRIIVAGGGGGAQYGDGGAGGGTNGMDSPRTVGGSSVSNFWGTPGTGGGQTLSTGSGQWGVGQDARTGSDGLYGGAGGGGYVGGGSAISDISRVDDYGGAGGSGYIGGVQNGVTIPGNQSMPSPSGGTQVGHSGHGYARISWNIPAERKVDWSTLKSLLGPAFQAIFNPNVIYNMTFGDGNLKGFKALRNCTLSVSGGQLVFNITGSDPQCELPVDIEAPAVMQIRITFDNNSSGTMGQLYFKKEGTTYKEADSIKWNMQANKTGQVVTLDISDVPSWSGKITGLRFDFSNASSGNVRVTKIEFIGFGTASGASGSGQVWNFRYTGNAQTWTAPYSGKYKLETWGAQGGSNGAEGGKGGYASGEINLTAGQKLYIFVGGKGGDGRNTTYDGGYNGGGYGYGYGGGGGGMTFISTSSSATAAPSNQARYGGSWNSTGVVIVAGGGGGAGSSGAPGGHGGGLTGGDGGDRYGSPGYGGTQTSGGSGGSNYGTKGGHGYGGSNTTDSSSGGGGGGGGWYGGGGGGNDYPNYEDNDDSGGGGGSGYIGGVQNGVLIPGNQSMPAPGGGNQIGQSGHGYARITSLSSVLAITYKPPINDTAILLEKLRNNYSLIPDKLPDGTDNFIWGCGGKPYNIHICNQNCREEIKLMCSEPHHNGLHYDGSNDICWDACNNDANHAFYKPKVITPTGEEIPNGKFINIDWPFRVYFPNIGDFYQGGKLGFSSITTTRGKGFVDNMDTTKWTRAKRIKFDFNVIYIDPITGEETLYRAGEWIELPVATQVERIELDSEGNPVPIYRQGTGISYYDFYCVLANREAKSAKIEYEVEAINCLGENDNKIAETNRKRYSDYTALHGGYKYSYIDVVGRIGNFVISDTDDYRFSNFFKVPVSDDEWLIEGIVKKVQPDVQNLYIGWKKDIRGVPVSASTHWLDTYGTQKWLDKAPVPFPLSPDKNNIPILKTQPMRPGYDILASIATIGNYARMRLQIVPYYYAMNLANGMITPVDAYMNVDGKYLPINIYDLVKPGWDSSKVYPYVLNLDWVEEAPRRNYDMTEKAQTDALADLYAELVMTPDASGELEVTGRRELDRPVGRYYNLGTAQLMTPGGKARTFIGSEYTYGKRMNIGNKIQAEDWWYAAQRWHLKFGLPSSTVFVEHGKPVTPEEIAKIANANTVVLLSVDIQAVGDTFVLRYTHEGDNGSITVNGKTFVLPPNIPPVVAVFSADRTAAHDVDIRRTH